MLIGANDGGPDKPEPGVEPEPLVTVAPNPQKTPEPSPTEEPDSAEKSKPKPAPDTDFDGLAGRWEFDSGVLVLFFGTSDYIEFEVHGDGTGTVFESADGESGKWYVDEDGFFVVEADWSGYYTFKLTLTDDTLTIIDEDGDLRQYKRAG